MPQDYRMYYVCDWWEGHRVVTCIISLAGRKASGLLNVL